MQKIIIKSLNNDSPEAIEETLEKALNSLQINREKQQIPDKYLKQKKLASDKIVSMLFSNMISEIAKVLQPQQNSQ